MADANKRRPEHIFEEIYRQLYGRYSDFQGCRQASQDREEKGGIKVHTVIHANEGVPSDIRFTSAATNDSFMLKPATLNKGDIMAMDRAYIDYEKFEQLSERGVVYVTKMKKSLKYKILNDTAYQNPTDSW